MRSVVGVVAALAVLVSIPQLASAQGGAKKAAQELARVEQAEATRALHLRTFDTLDFDVYTHQKWERLGESHAQDILVHYPDGHTTKGIAAHIIELKQMFVFAPDTRIEVHPVRIGDGEWTAVVGVIQGTFTQSMPLPGGKSIPPTGKAYKMSMATIGHWSKDGVMDEEYLFWDNLDFMKQIGLAQ